MRFMLPSRLVTTLTAAAIAMTAFTAVPAYADRDDRAARAIATILGLAVVGAIINDRKHERERRRDTHAAPVRRPHGYVQPRTRVQPKTLPTRVDRKLLPQQCFRSFNTRRGQVRMFGRRCLERNYRYVNRLPQNCFQRIRTNEGKRAGFGARCLRQNGYRLARG